MLDVVTVALNPVVDWTMWVPGFAPGKVNRVEREQTDAGGKGVNVASFLAGYGLRVAVAGLRGRDNGRIFRSFLSDHGIADRFVEIPGATRTGVKIVDARQGHTTDINFPGLAPQPADLSALEEVLRDLVDTAEWFVLTGRLPPGVSASFYGGWVRMLEDAGKHAVLDTSGEALLLGVAETPTLIKPNLEELSELAGRALNTESEILAVVRDLLVQGIQCVVVSMGARGALFARPGEALFAVPPHVAVTSTAGAGDALLAGTIAGLLGGLPLVGIARLATAFAAGALTRVTHALPAPEVVHDLAGQVVLRAFERDQVIPTTGRTLVLGQPDGDRPSGA
jgi:1-phosphofructokinase